MLDKRDSKYTKTIKVIDSAKISIIVSITIILIFSCKNKVDKIKEVSDSFVIPPNRVEEFVLTFTDSGMVKIKLESPVLINNNKDENTSTSSSKEFPNGVNITAFTNNSEIDYTVSANYGIYYPEKYFLEANGNVIIANKNKDSVLTEKIYWDQKKKLIYSDRYSRIVKNRQIIIGKNGFQSDENFTWYKIFNTEGNISIKDSL